MHFPQCTSSAPRIARLGTWGERGREVRVRVTLAPAPSMHCSNMHPLHRSPPNSLPAMVWGLAWGPASVLPLLSLPCHAQAPCSAWPSPTASPVQPTAACPQPVTLTLACSNTQGTTYPRPSPASRVRSGPGLTLALHVRPSSPALSTPGLAGPHNCRPLCWPGQEDCVLTRASQKQLREGWEPGAAALSTDPPRGAA